MLVEYGHAFLTTYPETLFGIPEQGSNLLDVDWRSVIFLSDGGKTPFSGLKCTRALNVPKRKLFSPSGRMAYTFSLINGLLSWLKFSMRPLLRCRMLRPPACAPMYTSPLGSSTYTDLMLLEPKPSSRWLSCNA